VREPHVGEVYRYTNPDKEGYFIVYKVIAISKEVMQVAILRYEGYIGLEVLGDWNFLIEGEYYLNSRLMPKDSLEYAIFV